MYSRPLPTRQKITIIGKGGRPLFPVFLVVCLFVFEEGRQLLTG